MIYCGIQIKQTFNKPKENELFDRILQAYHPVDLTV